MKYQTPFPGKNMKNIINLSSAEFSHSGKGYYVLFMLFLAWDNAVLISIDQLENKKKYEPIFSFFLFSTKSY